MLCSPFPSGFFLSTERFYTALLIKMYEALFSRLFLAQSERNQNIQDNPEYNSVLPIRIILKMFAVNMLKNKSKEINTFKSKKKSMTRCRCNYNALDNLIFSCLSLSCFLLMLLTESCIFIFVSFIRE